MGIASGFFFKNEDYIALKFVALSIKTQNSNGVIVIYFPYSFRANKFTFKLRYCIFLGYLQFKLTNIMVKLILGCTLNVNITFMDMNVSCNTCIFGELILSFEVLMQMGQCHYNTCLLYWKNQTLHVIV